MNEVTKRQILGSCGLQELGVWKLGARRPSFSIVMRREEAAWVEAGEQGHG